MTSNHYFIFAGEASGDLHGSSLLKSIRQRNPHIRITGVGGPAMREQGMECVLPMEAFQVMGFTDVIAALPKLVRQFYQVRDAILNSQPDAVILIDYPGFNLRMAKALRKKQYKGKIIQMISPTVWAWGKGRIDTMARTLDLLLTIYPFEAACFAHTPLKVEYIGHPLVERIDTYRYNEEWKQTVGIRSNAPIVALFPGSRHGEIISNLPMQIEAAKQFKVKYPDVQIAISCVDDKQKEAIEAVLKTNPLAAVFVPRKFTYELMRDSRAAIAKSGTVTLELALHKTPTVVMYQLSRLNRFIAEHILRLRLPHYCIVNVINGKTVLPEWIAVEATPERLSDDLKSLYSDGEKRTACLQGCLKTRQKLGSYKTGDLAAQCIERLS